MFVTSLATITVRDADGMMLPTEYDFNSLTAFSWSRRTNLDHYFPRQCTVFPQQPLVVDAEIGTLYLWYFARGQVYENRVSARDLFQVERRYINSRNAQETRHATQRAFTEHRLI